MFYVYVIEHQQTQLMHVGFTNDLSKRLKEHNKRGLLTSKKKSAWQVIYYEAYLNESDARRREEYFRTHLGRHAVKQRLHDYFYVRS